jgi:ABC-2 type transport system ATP-binding protein
VIDTDSLTKRFDNVPAVKDLTLHVDEGEVFGFLGPNGAGKTTTVRMLCCLISKTSGGAKIAGYEIGGPEQREIRRIIGLLPENVGLYDDLSAYENLDFYGRLHKRTQEQRRERIEYFLRMLGLWNEKDNPAGSFSKGMKQKLAIARCLIHDPRVLFLDEPTANLDPEASKTVRDFILELKREKRTIFLTTHLLDEAEKICDRVGILRTELLAVGTPAELRRSLRGRRTMIQLEQANDAVVQAVRRTGHQNVEVTGSSIVIEVADPEKENPDIIAAISAAGGRIQFITEVSPSLEDVYLQLMGD